MTFKLNGRGRLLAAMLAAATLAACSGDDGSDGVAGADGQQGPTGDSGVKGDQGDQGVPGTDGRDGVGVDRIPMAAGLTRLGTVPLGAEVTGAFVTDDGDLFFNVQHPSDTNAQVDERGYTYNAGTVGVVSGVNINKLPKNLVSVPVPMTDLERETVQLAYGEYYVIGQRGDTYGGAMPDGLGTIKANDNQTLIQTDDPDFNGFIPTGANEGYLFTNWESIPGGMSRLKLEKNPSTGLWSVDNSDVMMLDFGNWGTIANCFGSVSPWGTPLTSEEWGNFGDSTHAWNNPSSDVDRYGNRDDLARYTDPTANNAEDADPFPNTYRYHYIVEITDPTSATPIPVKHYAMGRFEHENSIVMPDQRTVYLSQDDSYGVFYKFVADNPGDLSQGTLYAAKITQDPGSFEPQTTGFDITWVELAHGNNAEIETWIAEYDDIDYSDYMEGKSSYITDADAIAWANGEANFPSYETAYQPSIDAGYTGANTFGGFVTAGKAMDNRVAFLESRKAARAKGATAEWQKFEGIYINQKRAKEAVEGTDLVPGETVSEAYVYFGIADMGNGLIDDEGDIRLSNRVNYCGGVYRMPLRADYNVDRIEPVLMGSTYRSNVDDSLQCDVNGLAQPDNVIVLDDGRIIIGEDGDQTNNTLWLYDPSVND